MQHDYTKALLALLESGTSLEDALRGLRAVLVSKHHVKLLPSILGEAVRVLESQKSAHVARVSVASASAADKLKAEIATALKALGTTSDTEVVQTFDATLVGGFVATYNHQERDQSYKRVLTSLYESIST